MSGLGKGSMISAAYLMLTAILVIILSPKEYTSDAILGGKPGKS